MSSLSLKHPLPGWTSSWRPSWTTIACSSPNRPSFPGKTRASTEPSTWPREPAGTSAQRSPVFPARTRLTSSSTLPVRFQSQSNILKLIKPLTDSQNVTCPPRPTWTRPSLTSPSTPRSRPPWPSPAQPTRATRSMPTPGRAGPGRQLKPALAGTICTPAPT